MELLGNPLAEKENTRDARIPKWQDQTMDYRGLEERDKDLLFEILEVKRTWPMTN
jgi:hypothetical protein